VTAPEESRGGPINYSDAGWGELVPQLGQLAAFIQQDRCGHLALVRTMTDKGGA
jgi:hypothetical protein